MREERERVLDDYLAASARLGDREALGRLVRRWQPKLLGHAYRLTGETELAGDITQEAWVEIIKSLPRLNDTGAFATWAFRIVTRRVARAIRKRQRRRTGYAALGREPLPESDPGNAAEDRAELATVRTAMAELPADQRAALGLFYLEDMRVAEIAVVLETAPGTIKTRLMHARNKLRTKLQGEET